MRELGAPSGFEGHLFNNGYWVAKLRQHVTKLNTSRAIEIYRENGFKLFPVCFVHRGICQCGAGRKCKQPGKHPACAHGFLDATDDTDQLLEWFCNGKSKNVGIATGSVSRLVVVDIDARNGGLASLKKLEAEGCIFPQTLTVESGSGDGSRHLYFKNLDTSICSGKLGGNYPGIDIKAELGYVVAPPSMHASGRQYVWQSASYKLDMCSIPEWLLQKLKLRSAASSKFTYRDLLKLKVTEGGRNETLTSTFGLLLWHELNPRLAIEVIHSLNATKCEPPLPQDDVDKIIRSILSRNRKGSAQ